MPTTIFGSQFLSGIGTDFNESRTFTAICAMQDIDLATRLIPSGDYTITVNVVVGEVNIFVPKHVKILVDGTVLFGTSSFHDGLRGWKKFIRNFRRGYGDGAPTVAYPDTSGEVRLRVRINGFLGAVRIYRLEHEAGLLRPGVVAVGV